MTFLKKTHAVFVVFVLVFSFCICFVSLSRAGLYQAGPRITSREYRNMLIAVRKVYADEGEIVNGASYNLPEPGILPTNPFYGFKSMRDWLWIKLTVDSVEKTKMYQYMADKKMSEAVALMGDSKTKDTYVAVEEGFSYLNKTVESISLIKEDKKDSAVQLKLHALEAGKAYAMIIGNFNASVTNSEYDRKQEWLGHLDDWNAKFEEEDN